MAIRILPTGLSSFFGLVSIPQLNYFQTERIFMRGRYFNGVGDPAGYLNKKVHLFDMKLSRVKKAGLLLFDTCSKMVYNIFDTNKNVLRKVT